VTILRTYIQYLLQKVIIPCHTKLTNPAPTVYVRTFSAGFFIDRSEILYEKQGPECLVCPKTSWHLIGQGQTMSPLWEAHEFSTYLVYLIRKQQWLIPT